MSSEVARELATHASLANILSLSRVGLAAALWVAPTRPAWLVAMAATAAVTDLADGWIARLQRTRRARRGGPRWLPADDVGAWLDPLCDKLFIASLVAATWVAVEAPLSRLVLIATRELLLVPLLGAYALLGPRGLSRIDFRARWPGKLTTVLQFAALLAVAMRHPAQTALAAGAAALGAIAVASYALRTARARRAHSA